LSRVSEGIHWKCVSGEKTKDFKLLALLRRTLRMRFYIEIIESRERAKLNHPVVISCFLGVL
jgi:hypothetical protein